MTRKWILIGLVGIGIYAIFSGEAFIEKKGMILASVSGNITSTDEVDYLKEKNQKLEIELLNLKCGNEKMSEIKTVDAKVFSVYPFSNRSELALNVGEPDGVIAGKAVIYNGYLVGKIKDVKKDVSIVTTVFDSGFKLPVRVGDHEIDALYMGGLDPKLNLIDGKEGILAGDLIISACSDFPYGLGIGRATRLKDGVMKEASVGPLFDMKNLRNVSVVID
ncbi:MAG: rod shape-determining protein MreC [Candidatus Colwellbacteria bacterium]|nr:rod shape-determining protein MreC [Candidatus Colwellbacteria bacterium]